MRIQRRSRSPRASTAPVLARQNKQAQNDRLRTTERERETYDRETARAYAGNSPSRQAL